MAPRTWTCRRQTRGVVCRHLNPRIKKKCEKCGKPRHKIAESPKSTRGLPPIEECIEIFGTKKCMFPGCEVEHSPERPLHRDHDHATMELRGILCFSHNFRIRRYMDWEFMKRAYVYLGNHEERMGRL